MENTLHAELLHVIAQVRRRWRLKHILRGAFMVAVASVLAFAASAFLLEKTGFSANAVIGFRVALGVIIAGLIVRYLVLPLARRVPDGAVALYLEEHEPSLDAIVVSALELGDEQEQRRAGLSPTLARRTIEAAIDRCHDIEDGWRIDRPQIRRFGALLASAVFAGLVLMLLSPGFLKHGASALLFRPADAASPYRIDVTPGNTTIPRGADQMVGAGLVGFAGEAAEVVFRTGQDSSFARILMVPGQDSAAFEAMLFAIGDHTDYFIESNGIRSPIYRITVEDLPFVRTLRLEYRFPSYTNLAPRVDEQGGDIATLAGTTVEVRATPTIPVESGEIVMSNGTRIPLRPAEDGSLVGEMRIQEDGFYHIEFPAQGRTISGSPQYTIDVLTDMPPTVRFSKPGRDTRVSAIEEVLLEARADDDYGVAEVELVYSVNAGPEQSVKMYQADGLREVTAVHTFFLEELGLEPGDLVSYYARVKDNAPGGTQKSATSDIYFLNVRPYGREYRQNQEGQQQQQGGGGGGGGGGGQQQDGELSERQREIVAATFNMMRDSANTPTATYSENVTTVALSQERLIEQVQTLAERMGNRGVTDDSMFAKIAAMLPQASAEMKKAADILREGRSTDALQPEQKALQILQRAEALFREVQVSFQQQQGGGGGGGGGGGSPNAEDLADLFELELDKLRNQYETVQRGEREQQENQVDETLERLRELAERQQQEAERLRNLAQRQQGGGQAAAQSQRQLAEETEEAARQLERLARETQQPELQETANQLREAADAMRRSAANARSGNPAEAARALQQLQEAQRRLQQNRSSAIQDRAQNALDRANQIAQDQREIAQQMNQLGESRGQERQELANRLVERKTEQATAIENLERDIDRLAQDARAEAREAARALQEASNTIRDNQLKEKVNYSRALTQPGTDQQYMRDLEREIGANIDSVRANLQRASQTLEQGASAQQGQGSLDRVENMRRGLESLQQQAAAAAEQQRRLGQQGQQGQGQQGQQGQGQGQDQGQQGQQGQGQQGQGQQGQGQQGQGQQGQGQQGQGQQGQGQQGQGQQGQGQQGQGQQGQGQQGQGQQGQGQQGQGQQGQGQQGQGQQGQGQQGQGQQGQGQQGQGQQGQGQQGQGQQGQGQQGQGQQGQGQQGQGQQGQDQQGQQQGGRGGRGGNDQPGGRRLGGGGGPDDWQGGTRGGWNDDNVRQFRGQAREWLREAQELRQDLLREGRDVAELDQVIEGLRELNEARAYGDPMQFVRLQTEVVDDIKQFEFRLKKEVLGTSEDKLFLSGSDEVPEAYRKFVEEYYKRLSQTQGGGGR